MGSTYDVTIMGGGLAGLTLALQIKKESPKTSILVLEKRKSDAKIGAHKVGESTVELGTYYLRNVLGLKEYLDNHHLPKYALRCFFSHAGNENIENRLEYGVRYAPPVPSHQLDRGILENDLLKIIAEMGVEVKMGTQVKEVKFVEDDVHLVKIQENGVNKTIKSKWVVDALGRVGFLKRKLGLIKSVEHNVNSVWFRVNEKLDVSDWSTSKEWKNKFEKDVRRLGTVHLMGNGYWVWILPLSSDITSVGIVTDERLHSFSNLDTLEKVFIWLKEYEPQFHKIITNKREGILDFRKLKNFALACKQFYSPNRWSLVGDSGAFLDPLYSPGTDFISLNNTWTSDLIRRELKGENIVSRSKVYNQVHELFFQFWIPIYKDKYYLLGNTQVMVVKITWDFVVYWGLPCVLFFNSALTDITVLKRLFKSERALGLKFSTLNSWVQHFFLDWGEKENAIVKNEFIDPADLFLIRVFLIGIKKKFQDNDSLFNQLEENYSYLCSIAAHQFRVVSMRLIGTPKDMDVCIPEMNLTMTKDKLLELSKREDAIPFSETLDEDMQMLWKYR